MGSEMCIRDRALAELQRQCPERFGNGAEAHKPLFRRGDGGPILASQIRTLLEVAGEWEGMPADRFGTHSLRIGGATALYHTVQDLERVKRFGRWKSDAFHGYLWESHEPQRGLSKGMVLDESSLTV